MSLKEFLLSRLKPVQVESPKPSSLASFLKSRMKKVEFEEPFFQALRRPPHWSPHACSCCLRQADKRYSGQKTIVNWKEEKIYLHFCTSCAEYFFSTFN